MGQRQPLLLVIIILIAFSNCNKENTPTPAPTNTQQITISGKQPTSNFETGYLDNEAIVLRDNPTYFTDVSDENDHNADGHNDNGNGNVNNNGNGSNNGNGNDNTDPDDDQSLLTTGCSWSTVDSLGIASTTGTVELRKEIFRIYVTPFLSNHYYDMLQPGSYGYAYHNNSKNGAYVTVRDRNGVLWTSKGDQTGSTFTITSRGANMQTYATVTGTFSCKLYDSNGNVKTFTGGTFNANWGL